MEEKAQAYFHKLYGVRKPRTAYYAKDFVDYVLMVLLTAAVIGVSYGFRHALSITWFVLCPFAIAMFIVRHGIELKVPLILRRPQDALYMCLYKIQNLHPLWLIAIAVLLLENVLIAATPNLPHHVEIMRQLALWLFYAHIIGLTVYRTMILVDHLKKKELVREILMQTPWKRTINQKTNITLEILHAYVTGLLAHIALIAPWYFVLTHIRYSLVFLPIVCVINILQHTQWVKELNWWFYRDHWLGHNSELEFLYLHGVHHDAIPSALIAVGENGFLEGFLRHAIGGPISFYHPLVSFALNSNEVANDMQTHQYIPGLFPKISRRFVEVAQHSTHHFGQLEPYTMALKLDQPFVTEKFKKAWRLIPYEFANCIRMDEELTGFRWDNPTHRNFLNLHAKYQPPKTKAAVQPVAVRIAAETEPAMSVASAEVVMPVPDGKAVEGIA